MTELFEYDIYVPTVTSQGRAVSAALRRRYKTALVKHFGGITDFRRKNSGVWKLNDVEFFDEMILYRVLGPKRRSCRKFLRDLQQTMQRELKQKQILIVERSVLSL